MNKTIKKQLTALAFLFIISILGFSNILAKNKNKIEWQSPEISFSENTLGFILKGRLVPEDTLVFNLKKPKNYLIKNFKIDTALFSENQSDITIFPPKVNLELFLIPSRTRAINDMRLSYEIYTKESDTLRYTDSIKLKSDYRLFWEYYKRQQKISDSLAFVNSKLITIQKNTKLNNFLVIGGLIIIIISVILFLIIIQRNKKFYREKLNNKVEQYNNKKLDDFLNQFHEFSEKFRRMENSEKKLDFSESDEKLNNLNNFIDKVERISQKLLEGKNKENFINYLNKKIKPVQKDLIEQKQNKSLQVENPNKNVFYDVYISLKSNKKQLSERSTPLELKIKYDDWLLNLAQHVDGELDSLDQNKLKEINDLLADLYSYAVDLKEIYPVLGTKYDPRIMSISEEKSTQFTRGTVCGIKKRGFIKNNEVIKKSEIIISG